MRATASFVLLAGIIVLLGGGVRAEEQAKPPDARAAFAETDTDGNGLVDLAEFHARMIDIFYLADTDKNGYLSPDEFARLVFSEGFKEADLNGDGRLSLHEFVAVRFRQFEAADTNHDGELSLDEVLAAYEGREKP
jgi:Ca2+-binding EF-hand superfamily protein